MASTRIDVQINGKDNTSGAYKSAASNINKLGADAKKTGTTIGSSIGSGASQAANSLIKMASQGASAFKMIQTGAKAASDSLGGMGSAVASIAGGFGAMEAASMMWTGATQRQFNEMYLGSRMGTQSATEYLDVIQSIVAQVPGDDTWMNALLTGALARETSMNADMLQRLGTVASKYVTAAQQTGAAILPVNAERELSAYIKTGNTGLMVRDGLLKNHVDELEKAKTPTERILALEKAMTEEGYLQLDTQALASSKWEEIKGRIQLAATTIGTQLLPFIEKILDGLTWLDEKTNGWATMIGFAGAALGLLAIAVAPIVTATASAAIAMKAYRKDAEAAAIANGLNKGPGTPVGGGGVTGTLKNWGSSIASGMAAIWATIAATTAGAAALSVGTAFAAVATVAWSAWEQGLAHKAVDTQIFNPTRHEGTIGQWFVDLGESAKNKFQDGMKNIINFDDVGKSMDGLRDWIRASLTDAAIGAAFGNIGASAVNAAQQVYNAFASTAMQGVNALSNGAHNLYNYISGGTTGTVRVIQKTFSSIWNAAASLYNYIRAGATGWVRVFTDGISSAWNAVNNLYNTVRAGATGVVTTIRQTLGLGPAGPGGAARGPFDGMDLNYENYGGMKKSPWTASGMSGNCVDMSLGLIQAAGGGNLVSGTWNGGPHVWANIGGKDYDPARKALEGTWSPPARGPGGPGGSGITIVGDVYGFNDFADKVESAMNVKIRRVY